MPPRKVIPTRIISGNQTLRIIIEFVNNTETTQDNEEEEDDYDHAGALKFIIVTLLVYALFGIVGTLMLRMKRKAKKSSKVQRGQEESLVKYLKSMEEIKLKGFRDILQRERLKSESHIINCTNKKSSLTNLSTISENSMENSDVLTPSPPPSSPNLSRGFLPFFNSESSSNKYLDDDKFPVFSDTKNVKKKQDKSKRSLTSKTPQPRSSDSNLKLHIQYSDNPPSKPSQNNNDLDHKYSLKNIDECEFPKRKAGISILPLETLKSNLFDSYNDFNKDKAENKPDAFDCSQAFAIFRDPNSSFDQRKRNKDETFRDIIHNEEGESLLVDQDKITSSEKRNSKNFTDLNSENKYLPTTSDILSHCKNKPFLNNDEIVDTPV